MCGRFTLRTPANVIIQQFGLQPDDPNVMSLPTRFNIAPTQPLLTVRQAKQGSRETAMLRWGLIPFWAKDISIGNRMINARSETIADKPSFKRAFRTRRCLVVADGYYEWKKTGRTKQPFYFHRPDDRPFALAGLWESWTPGDRQGESGITEEIQSCTIVTTEANQPARDIHDRMPVILQDADYDCWLEGESSDLARLQELLQPAADDFLQAYPISTFVNKPTNDGPTCIERIQANEA